MCTVRSRPETFNLGLLATASGPSFFFNASARQLFGLIVEYLHASAGEHRGCGLTVHYAEATNWVPKAVKHLGRVSAQQLRAQQAVCRGDGRRWRADRLAVESLENLVPSKLLQHQYRWYEAHSSKGWKGMMLVLARQFYRRWQRYQIHDPPVAVCVAAEVAVSMSGWLFAMHRSLDGRCAVRMPGPAARLLAVIVQHVFRRSGGYRSWTRACLVYTRE
jgi:hypothetical protein